MKRPEEVTLSREDGEALITRLEADALTAEDRRVLVKILTHLGLPDTPMHATYCAIRQTPSSPAHSHQP